MDWRIDHVLDLGGLTNASLPLSWLLLGLGAIVSLHLGAKMVFFLIRTTLGAVFGGLASLIPAGAKIAGGYLFSGTLFLAGLASLGMGIHVKKDAPPVFPDSSSSYESAIKLITNNPGANAEIIRTLVKEEAEAQKAKYQLELSNYESRRGLSTGSSDLETKVPATPMFLTGLGLVSLGILLGVKTRNEDQSTPAGKRYA